MIRPSIVVIGGTEDQPLACVYCGADGAEALDTYQAAANDGNNELVRLFIYPDYARVATPKKDGVEPAELPEVEEDNAPTAEEHEAAQASIKDLFAQLEDERAKTAECERSNKAALSRIGKLEAMLEKAVAKAKPAPVQAEKPAVDPAAKPE